MNISGAEDRIRLERRSLSVAMWGNLFMAAAGLFAGVLSNSDAVMMDGLFSLIGFGSAVIARQVSRRIGAGPDKARPFGYSADEAIFSTFLSLSLLGLVLFAITNAAKNIYNYFNGIAPEPLNFAPMILYFTVVGMTCAILWWFHRSTWRRTGRNSSILQLEAKAALFDGLITAAAGVGLAAIYFFREGPLALIAPIGDSIIVLLLCLLAIGTYVREFRGGLGELAGRNRHRCGRAGSSKSMTDLRRDWWRCRLEFSHDGLTGSSPMAIGMNRARRQGQVEHALSRPTSAFRTGTSSFRRCLRRSAPFRFCELPVNPE